jgi:hypothetical protein
MDLKFRLLIPVIVFLFSSLVFSATYYVSASKGSDDNAGAEKMPFKTIQKAADVMVAGDICLIDDGIYRETITLKNSGTKDKPISFKAMEDADVVISGTEVVEANWVGYFDYDRTWTEDGEKTFQSEGVSAKGKNYTALYMDGELITRIDSPKELDGPAKWFLNVNGDRVSIILWPPAKDNISDSMDDAYNSPVKYTIEAKLRDFAFIASNIDYIVVSGISFFAVENKLDNSNNWSIDTK